MLALGAASEALAKREAKRADQERETRASYYAAVNAIERPNTTNPPIPKDTTTMAARQSKIEKLHKMYVAALTLQLQAGKRRTEPCPRDRDLLSVIGATLCRSRQ